MIYGVTGNYGSGKDTVAEILEKLGFEHISFSDILREELRKEKKAITRENLISIENKDLYDTSTVSYRKVFSESHFCYKSNRYSVPYKHVGKEVGIKENDSKIKVIYQ